MPAGDTKDKILDAAEKLFAEQGIADTSLRKVTSAAGVNIAAVHYHFGSREALVQEVIRRRIDVLNERRLSLLRGIELRYETGKPPVREIMEALLLPAFEMALETQSGQQIMRIMGQVHTQTDPEMKRFIFELFSPLIQEYLRVLHIALPEVSRGELLLRFYFSVGSFAFVMLNRGNFPPFVIDEIESRGGDAAMVASLVDFATRGMVGEQKGSSEGKI